MEKIKSSNGENSIDESTRDPFHIDANVDFMNESSMVNLVFRKTKLKTEAVDAQQADYGGGAEDDHSGDQTADEPNLRSVVQPGEMSDTE
ncbi:hypothetical protein HPP92_028882 [Vanilla planifolia]|uniref:Uncharacterized protein n=1 Tax=Vanilla planifolia TaxID=51239 RepID=A0A835U2D1_VANPL|nr:hypothetical protein HPP92_028882 [Vanilla planifolia]